MKAIHRHVIFGNFFRFCWNQKNSMSVWMFDIRIAVKANFLGHYKKDKKVEWKLATNCLWFQTKVVCQWSLKRQLRNTLFLRYGITNLLDELFSCSIFDLESLFISRKDKHRIKTFVLKMSAKVYWNFPRRRKNWVLTWIQLHSLQHHPCCRVLITQHSISLLWEPKNL